MSGAVFPRDQKELAAAGEEWLTHVLQQNGTLSETVTVTSMKLADANNGGLLGEMCMVDVTYSGETTAPTKLVAKFRPPGMPDPNATQI